MILFKLFNSLLSETHLYFWVVFLSVRSFSNMDKTHIQLKYFLVILNVKK